MKEKLQRFERAQGSALLRRRTARVVSLEESGCLRFASLAIRCVHIPGWRGATAVPNTTERLRDVLRPNFDPESAHRTQIARATGQHRPRTTVIFRLNNEQQRSNTFLCPFAADSW